MALTCLCLISWKRLIRVRKKLSVCLWVCVIVVRLWFGVFNREESLSSVEKTVHTLRPGIRGQHLSADLLFFGGVIKDGLIKVHAGDVHLFNGTSERTSIFLAVKLQCCHCFLIIELLYNIM